MGAQAHAQSSSIVSQSGDNNGAEVEQVGDNTSTIEQVNNVPAVLGQRAIVFQRGLDGNVADIVQDAAGSNSASAIQSGQNSFATISQIGSSINSSAVIGQGPLTDSNVGIVTQTGDPVTASTLGNVASIAQSAGADGNGSNNFAEILQGDTTRAAFPGTVTGGFGNQTNAVQAGDNNFLETVQGGANFFAFISQLGSANIHSSAQGDLGGSSGFLTLFQEGARNTSFVGQSSTSSQATINQVGEDNQSGVDQGLVGLTATGGDRNFASVNQTGNNNESNILQNSNLAGGDNLSIVTQINDDNLSVITQDGSSSLATVSQADGSASFVTQGGTNNTATVIQGTP
ncbi:MAG: hypothetical protein ABJN35_01390 [Erythrobacter sp.]